MKSRLGSLIVIVACACVPLFARTGGIVGTITAGPNATPYANARVMLRMNGRQQIAQTDVDGNYSFPAVPAAIPCSLRVEAEGLRPFTQAGVLLQDGETRRIDTTLLLADTHYSVLVTEGVINLEAAAPEVSQHIDEKEIKQVPSVTRSVAKYALLDPHVRQVVGLGGDFQDANRLSINAGSYRHTGYMLDGTANYDWIYANNPQATIAPAAVEEVKVMTGQYSAQYGQSTLGIIAVRTASGTGSFHGEGFAYVRPSSIQALPPLATFHVPNEREDWGATFGGPILRNRTYFFSSYEGVMQDRGAFIQSPVPSFFEGETHEQYGLVRVDHNINSNHLLTARFNGFHFTTNNANDRVSGFNQPSFGRESRIQSWGGQISERAIWGNRVNEARVSFTNYFPDGAFPLETSVGAVVTQCSASNPDGSCKSYSPYGTWGYSTSNWVHARTVNTSDLLAFRSGRHDLKFGGEVVRLDARDYSYTPFGTYSFHTPADYAAGNAFKYTQIFGEADVTYGQTEVSGFVQDDIRMSPRLSASLGLRYEFQSITDSRRNFGPRIGLAWDATGDGKTMLRVGGAIFYDQYYMYLNRRFITLGPHSPQATYTWNVGDPGFPTYPNSFASAPNGGSTGKLDLYIPGPQLLNPYSVQFSTTLERQVTSDMVLSLSGLYVHTLKQMRVDDINHPAQFTRSAPNQSQSTQAADATRPFATFDGLPVRDIAQIENSASSDYQSLDIGLKKRLLGWGQFGLHYLFSASYAYSLFYADANSGVPNDWVTDWDRYERGPSDFYQRHRFVGDALLNLPWHSQLSLVATMASGLPVNPITGRDNNGDSYTVDRPIGFGRNSFRGPLQANLDTSVSKRFKITEKLQTETRFEVFNVFNRMNFIKVNNTYGEGPEPTVSFLAPVAGITNSDPSRQFQFAIRLLF